MPSSSRAATSTVRSVGDGGNGVASPAAALGVQPKLQINRPGDRYEQQADAVASAVTSGAPAPPISKLPPGGLMAEGGTAQRQAAEEEEPVQMQALEEEEPTQMQELEDEEPAQRQELDDEEPMQKREATGASGRGAGASAAASAMRQAGAGSPLPSPVRSRIEGSTGRDFSGVRVHDGGAAQRAADAINARAFTRGSDIYLGRGASPTDTQLMAHEATHVVQQEGLPPAATSGAQRLPVQRDAVQRTENESEDAAGDTGELNEQKEEIRFQQIEIPPFKKRDHRGTLYDAKDLRRKKAYDRGKPKQRTDVWIPKMKEQSSIQEHLEGMVDSQFPGKDPRSGSYAFSVFGTNRYLVGDLSTVAEELTVPNWGYDGSSLVFNNNFHVDHIVELQLSGWDGEEPQWANSLENMELLDGSKNTSSGATIKSNIRKKAEAFAEATENQYGTRDQILERYDLVFDRAVSGAGVDVTRGEYWKADEIEKADHLKPANAIRALNISSLGEEGTVLVFPSASGGSGKGFTWGPEEQEARQPTSRGEREWLKPFTVTQVQFFLGGESEEESGPFGVFTVRVPEGEEGFEGYGGDTTELTVHPIEGAQYAGHFRKSRVKSIVTEKLGIKGASPIRVDRLDVDPETGLIVEGKLLPTVPLIRDADIDVFLRGGNLSISKTFQIGDYNFPGPVTVTQSNLTLSVGTESGLSLSGRADLEVEDVGTGHLEGDASTEEGFHIAGGFDFDSELFTEASIDLAYHKPPNGEAVLSGEGTLAIGRHKVKGIKSASIDVAVENEAWTADGTVDPEIKGVEQGELSAAYDPEQGFAIAGRLQLSGDIPGIRGGSLEGRVRKRESGEGYKMLASGEADLDIPGVSSTIGVTYDDGLFEARTSVGYERGMLSGRLAVGVTNQPLGDNGQPVRGGEGEGDPGADLRAFGGGELTLGLAPWLQATAGVQLLPNGEVEMRGEIGIPDVIELFPERRYEKRLFQIGIDVPIVGVAVAGQRIGIFATVSGGLDATASIGPGELRDANLSVEYNPDREEETTVTGHALFVIPAFAGLRLFVRGGVGAGIPVVSAEAGLEVGGEIGLEGAAEAEADVDWNPQAGLALHAEGRIFAEPSFLFDVSGYANVSADLVLTSVDLYDERFRLASYEWGSGMRVGVTFPVDYREGEPFSLSTDDIQFVYPRINPRSLISGIVDEAT